MSTIGRMDLNLAWKVSQQERQLIARMNPLMRETYRKVLADLYLAFPTADDRARLDLIDSYKASK